MYRVFNQRRCVARRPGRAQRETRWSRIWKFGAGVGHFFAGDFLNQSNYTLGYTVSFR